MVEVKRKAMAAPCLFSCVQRRTWIQLRLLLFLRTFGRAPQRMGKLSWFNQANQHVWAIYHQIGLANLSLEGA